MANETTLADVAALILEQCNVDPSCFGLGCEPYLFFIVAQGYTQLDAVQVKLADLEIKLCYPLLFRHTTKTLTQQVRANQCDHIFFISDMKVPQINDTVLSTRINKVF